MKKLIVLIILFWFILLSNSVYALTTTDDNLVLMLKLDEADTPALDSKNNKHPNYKFSETADVTWQTAAVVNQSDFSITPDGDSGYLSNTSFDTNTSLTISEFTASVWAIPTYGADKTLIEAQTGTADGFRILQTGDAGGQIRCQVTSAVSENL